MKRLLIATICGCISGAVQARTLESDTALSENTDWSGEELVIPEGITLDLNGFDLTVGSVSGGGTITDSRTYVLLEYTESTGYQYMLTGYQPGEKTSVAFDFMPGNDGNGSAAYFGCKWQPYAWMLCTAGGNMHFFSGGTNYGATKFNERLSYTISDTDFSTLKKVATGEVIGTASVSRSNNFAANGFSVFGNPGANPSRCRVYSFKIWEDGALVRDYVPARDPASGAVGLFDRVTRALQTSATSTPLVAGGDAESARSVGTLRFASASNPFASFTGAVAETLMTELAADVDASAEDSTALRGRQLDLCGHRLTVRNLAGSANVTDSKTYVELEYARSSGSQYVKTGIVPGEKTRVSFDFMPLNSKAALIYLGHGWELTSWSFGQTSDREGFFCFFGSGNNLGTYVANRRYGFNVDLDNRVTLCDLESGAIYGSAIPSLSNSNSRELCVFGGNNSRFSSIRVYGLKICEDGTLVRDYIPARDPASGAVGLLDRVNNTFATSETSTALIAGEDKGDPVSRGEIRISGDGYALAGYDGSMSSSVRVVLASDADWTSEGNVALPTSTLDLNGHALKVAGLSGGGYVVDSKQFEKLEAVECDKRQRMPTNYLPDENTTMEFDFTTVSYADGAYYFGTEWNARAWLFCTTASNIYFFGWGEKLLKHEAGLHLRLNVDSDNKVRLYDADSAKLLSFSGTSRNNDNGSETWIFGSPSRGVGSHGEYRLHAFRIWKSGVPQRDYVPARDPDTLQVGLFDRVNRTHSKSALDTGLLCGARIAKSGVGVLEIVPGASSSVDDFTGALGDGVRCSLAGADELTLSGDLDLRSLGGVAVDAKVNLNGHQLSLSTLDGCGALVDDSVRTHDLCDAVSSTGSQFVRTSFAPNEKTSFDFEFTTGAYTSGAVLFGGDWQYYAWSLVSAENQLIFFGDGNRFMNYPENRALRLTCTPADGMVLTDGVTGETLATKSPPLSNAKEYEMKLFGLGSGNRCASYSLRRFRIWDDGVAKFDFVPARDISTGSVGLLDRLSGNMFTSATSTPLVGGTVTNDLPSRVVVDVGEGASVTNGTVTIGGNVQLVKRGEGTLTMAKIGQSYSAGTSIEAGTLATPCDAARPSTYAGTSGCVGADGSTISVEADAAFDPEGNPGYGAFTLVLNGGTLMNGGMDGNPSLGGLGNVRLTANSSVTLSGDMVFGSGTASTIDLGGHTLAIATGANSVIFTGSETITAGSLVLTGGGTLDVRSTVNAASATLATDGPIALTGTLSVLNYTAGADDAVVNSGSGTLNVYGTFAPNSDYFYGCTILDGARVDLSGRDGAWSVESLSTGGRGTASFASGATVTLDFGSRTLSGDSAIVTWNAMPSGVAFVIAGAVRDAGVRLSIGPAGLYAADALTILCK